MSADTPRDVLLFIGSRMANLFVGLPEDSRDVSKRQILEVLRKACERFDPVCEDCSSAQSELTCNVRHTPDKCPRRDQRERLDHG